MGMLLFAVLSADTSMYTLTQEQKGNMAHLESDCLCEDLFTGCGVWISR